MSARSANTSDARGIIRRKRPRRSRWKSRGIAKRRRRKKRRKKRRERNDGEAYGSRARLLLSRFWFRRSDIRLTSTFMNKPTHAQISAHAHHLWLDGSFSGS